MKGTGVDEWLKFGIIKGDGFGNDIGNLVFLGNSDIFINVIGRDKHDFRCGVELLDLGQQSRSLDPGHIDIR